MTKKCGNCAHIGGHAWGLPHDKKECGKLKARQADFDARTKNMDPVDRFRFRPAGGVYPYSSAERCGHYSPQG